MEGNIKDVNNYGQGIHHKLRSIHETKAYNHRNYFKTQNRDFKTKGNYCIIYFH